MHAYDKGATAKLTFGRDEYEFWVTVPPAEVAKLAAYCYGINSAAGCKR